MASLNKCTFIGNLTKDPELRYLTNGEAVTNVTIACNEQWKDKLGAKQESVEFVNLVFYRKLAEIAGEYLKKGAPIYVEGKMKTRKWQDKDTGKDRYINEIIVNEMQMLGSKSDSHAESQKPAKQSNTPSGDFSDMDSDIPFREPCLHYGLWRSI